MSLKVLGSKKEAQQNRNADQQSRDIAPRILNPTQIQGKTWTATKILETTLGLSPGEKPRAITKKDFFESM